MTAAAGYLLVAALERALSLVIMPITTRLFSHADFAQLIAINNVSTLLNLVVGLFLVRGLPAVMAAQPDDRARRDAATTIFLGTGALGAGVLAVMWPLAPAIGAWLNQPEGFAGLFRLALAAMFVVLMGQCLQATARSLERHALAIGVQSVALVVQAGCVLALLLVTQFGLISIFWAGLGAGVTALVGYLLRLGGLITGKPQISHLARAGKVSTHLLALKFGALVILNCAGLILNWAGRPDEAAAFSIAAGAAGIGTLACFAFDSAWTPHLLRRAADPAFAATARRMFEHFSAAFLLGGASGALFAHEVFAVLVGPRFVRSYKLVPPLIGAYALFAFANNFAQGILLDARPQRFAWIGLATAAAFLAMALPAVLTYGAYGLIAAMALAFALMTALAQMASHATLPISYPWAKHAAIWAIASLLVGWAAYLPLGWGTVAVKTGVWIALLGVLLASSIRLPLPLPRLWALGKHRHNA